MRCAIQWRPVPMQAFAREKEEQARFGGEAELLLGINLNAVRARSIFLPCQGSLGNVGGLIMMAGGGYLTLTGEFTVGGLIALRGYWWWLYGPLQMLGELNDMIQRAAASGKRIYEVLDAPVEVADAPDAAALPQIRGAVRFSGAGFRYPRGDEVLAGLDLDVAPGEKIGLVGTSGAGKSTLLMLIPRFYDLTGGTLSIDGQDVRRVRLADLRRRVGIVLQDTYLFNCTVAENIRYGRPDASDEELAEAARMASAHEFIEALPQGYATVVGERGVKLSGGQKQRIAIARAFLSAPAILILDEATSAVEPESERVIQDALERLMAGRTAFVTSHRYSMLRGMDRICVLDGGRVVEEGPHEALLAEGGLYAAMYRMQTEREPEPAPASEAPRRAEMLFAPEREGEM